VKIALFVTMRVFRTTLQDYLAGIRIAARSIPCSPGMSIKSSSNNKCAERLRGLSVVGKYPDFLSAVS